MGNDLLLESYLGTVGQYLKEVLRTTDWLGRWFCARSNAIFRQSDVGPSQYDCVACLLADSRSCGYSTIPNTSFFKDNFIAYSVDTELMSEIEDSVLARLERIPLEIAADTTRFNRPKPVTK